MSNYDWEEVKRLAADFQNAQLISTSQKLSESNCVEIITKLTQLKLLDVVFTTDGKNYVTPSYLIKEIKDELYIRNGRVNLIDVAKSLNIDLNVTNSLAQTVVKEKPDVQIIQGQLIDNSYIVNIAEEIGDKLMQHGLVNVTELARLFDLPGDFIHSIIRENNGKLIKNIKQDKHDSLIYYTDAFLNQNKAIARGSLLAITKPTSISTIISQCGINENIFYSLIDNLMETKQIPGILTERYGNVCTYIPQIYLKAQTEWVHNFYKQNSYLEYDALTRVGINDPKSFITKCLSPEEHLQYLKKCAVGQQLIEQVETSIEEAVNSNSWINILSVLPTIIDSDDAGTILRNSISKQRKATQIFNQTYAVSEQFINCLRSEIVEKIVPLKVNEVMKTGAYDQYLIDLSTNISGLSDGDKRELSRKEERKKRANVGKSGGGTQGRETKTKSTKKKYGKSAAVVDSDDESHKQSSGISVFEIVSSDDIQQIIEANKSFQDEEFDNSEFIEELLQYLIPIVNKIAIAQAQIMHETRQANQNNSKRKMNAELQDNIIVLYQDLKLYHRGIKEFNDEDCRLLLIKYLLKNTGSQLVNTCFTFVSDRNEEVTTPEARQKVLNGIGNKELKDTFSKLNKSLNGTNIEEFSNNVDNVLAGLNIMMRKVEKKKEKLLMESHKQALIEKLKETDSPSLILHLISLILFQTITQNMLTASGRFVSNILKLLEKRLPNEANEILQSYHKLVMELFKLSEEDEAHKALHDKFDEMSPAVKNLVYTVFSK